MVEAPPGTDLHRHLYLPFRTVLRQLWQVAVARRQAVTDLHQEGQVMAPHPEDLGTAGLRAMLHHRLDQEGQVLHQVMDHHRPLRVQQADLLLKSTRKVCLMDTTRKCSTFHTRLKPVPNTPTHLYFPRIFLFRTTLTKCLG